MTVTLVLPLAISVPVTELAVLTVGTTLATNTSGNRPDDDPSLNVVSALYAWVATRNVTVPPAVLVYFVATLVSITGNV